MCINALSVNSQRQRASFNGFANVDGAREIIFKYIFCFVFTFFFFYTNTEINDDGVL